MVKDAIRNYLSSFKLNKDFIYVFLIDVILFSFIFTSFYLFSGYLQKKSAELMQGRTPEQLQQLLTSSNPEQILPFLLDVRTFLLLSLLLLVVLVVAAVFLFSFSQAMIWNRLLKRKLTKYWRWNLLNLSLIIPAALLGIVYLLAKLIAALVVSLPFKFFPKFSLMHPQFALTASSIVNNAVGFYLVLTMALIIFLIYCAFTLKYKVWDSIGEGFKLFKEKWKLILGVAFFAAITALIITLITIPLRKIFIYLPLASGFVNLVLASLFFAWLRLYLLRVVHGHQ